MTMQDSGPKGPHDSHDFGLSHAPARSTTTAPTQTDQASHASPKNSGGSWFSWFYGDKRLVLFFLVIDLCLIALAHRHFSNFQRLTSDPFLLKPSEVEAMDLSKLQELGAQGAWDSLESFRLERVSFYQNSDLRPSKKTLFYFFPELLLLSSLERQFLIKKIQPALQALRAAHVKKDASLTKSAFELLRTRILNYESGGTSDGFMSKESQDFLALYERMVLE